MKQQLLIEDLKPSEANVVTESTEDGKKLYLNGIFMQAEMQNRNGRNYPLAEMTKAVEKAQAHIKEHGGIFGELDHPQSLNINLDRVTHVIEDLRLEGNNVIGRARILDTPMGQIAKTLIESGVKVGVSSRGSGGVNEGVVSDFDLITVDIVATPSAHQALPAGVYESLQHSKEGKEVMTLAEQVRNDASAQEKLKSSLMEFINNLGKKDSE